MKKFLAILTALTLALTFAIPTFAADELANVFDKLPDKYSGATVVTLIDQWSDGATNARSGKMENYSYVFLKNDGKGDFVVKFTVDKEAVYDFGFTLMGWTKSVLRATDVSVDGGTKYRIAYDYAESDQYRDHYFYGLKETLKPGEHTMTFSLTSDFDDSTVKTPYFINFFYVSEDLPAAAADTVDTAPKTADTLSVALLALVVSGLGVTAVIRKKKV